MKRIFESIKTKMNFEILTENEMLHVRGGKEKTKPVSRPKDVYGDEDE